MAKYTAFDRKLFAWLDANREDVTTAQANAAIGADTSTKQRHVSRRFTQLEDRGILQCRLVGTTRVCTVQKTPPLSITKKRWTPTPVQPTRPIENGSSIVASTSDEFVAAGGVIQYLPAHWNQLGPSKALGPMTFFEQFNDFE